VHDIGSYFPTEFGAEELADAASVAVIKESLLAEAVGYYEKREEELGAEVMRDIERQVMLSIIDQRWREHLYEMDYLQEGINLRAMGQKDPLTEWQREGFDMFTLMMEAIADDFVKYVMHLNVVVEQPNQPDVVNVQYSAAEDPVAPSGMARAAERQASADGEVVADAGNGADEAMVAQVVRSEHEKVGRNEPCWCGSTKKFKVCHGK